MPLLLTLPSELEERLQAEAERSGLGKENIALRVLDEHLPPKATDRLAVAVALLRQWAKDDESLSAEELAGNTEVLRALDANRPSYRKLFTDLLKDDPG